MDLLTVGSKSGPFAQSVFYVSKNNVLDGPVINLLKALFSAGIEINHKGSAKLAVVFHEMSNNFAEFTLHEILGNLIKLRIFFHSSEADILKLSKN